MFTEHDGNIEHLSAEEQNKPAVFRFRPPQIGVFTKYVLSILRFFLQHLVFSAENYSRVIITMVMNQQTTSLNQIHPHEII